MNSNQRNNKCKVDVWIELNWIELTLNWKNWNDLEKVGVAESGAETEDEVALRMLGNGLHDGAVDDDQVLGRGLHVAAVAWIARVEQQRRALQTDPVAAPAALSCQLYLVLLPQQPFLHAQETEIQLSTNYNWFSFNFNFCKFNSTWILFMFNLIEIQLIFFIV